MAARKMPRLYCTKCHSVDHQAWPCVLLCSHHAAATDLLLALQRIRLKAFPALASGKFTLQTLDSIDEIAEQAIAGLAQREGHAETRKR